MPTVLPLISIGGVRFHPFYSRTISFENWPAIKAFSLLIILYCTTFLQNSLKNSRSLNLHYFLKARKPKKHHKKYILVSFIKKLFKKLFIYIKNTFHFDFIFIIFRILNGIYFFWFLFSKRWDTFLIHYTNRAPKMFIIK